MKFEAMKDVLTAAMADCGRIAAGKQSRAICSMVRVTAELRKIGKQRIGSVTIEATDLDRWVRWEIAADVEIEGSAAIPAAGLDKFVRSSVSEKVAVEVLGGNDDDTGWGRAQVSDDEASARLNCADVEEFPNMDRSADGARFVWKVRAGVLIDALDSTIPCVAKSEKKYAINGLFLNAKDADGRAVIAATDGHVLCVADFSPDETDGEDRNALIPLPFAADLRRIAAGLDAQDIVTLSVTDRQAIASAGVVTIGAQLIEGLFPPYSGVIPTDPDHSADWDAKDFQRCLKRVVPFCGALTDAVTFEVSASGKLSEAYAHGEDAEARVSCACASTLEMKFASRPEYLIHASEKVKTGDRVQALFEAPKNGQVQTPMLFERSQDTIRVRFVVMPLRPR